MEQTCCKLTVFFEDPFWVGIYERQEAGSYSACKLIFGAEPRDGQVWELILSGFHRLRFSPGIECRMAAPRRTNPKRAQRAARKELAGRDWAGTKAQQALALQRDEGKAARKKRSRQEKDAEAVRQFELRQEKRREKHKGH